MHRTRNRIPEECGWKRGGRCHCFAVGSPVGEPSSSELHEREVIARASVPGERASAVVRLLAQLVAERGAPLVLKADNGSAFTSGRVAEFCREHGIVLLFSPVRRPRCNGICEVSGRWAKNRATEAMCRRGGVALQQGDLDAAVGEVSIQPRVEPLLRGTLRGGPGEQRCAVAKERGLARLGPPPGSCASPVGTRRGPASASTLPHPDNRRPCVSPVVAFPSGVKTRRGAHGARAFSLDSTGRIMASNVTTVGVW